MKGNFEKFVVLRYYWDWWTEWYSFLVSQKKIMVFAIRLIVKLINILHCPCQIHIIYIDSAILNNIGSIGVFIAFFRLVRGADREPRAREAGPEASIYNYQNQSLWYFEIIRDLFWLSMTRKFNIWLVSAIKLYNMYTK